MRPENVHIFTPTTWPPETVFVIFKRWQKEGMSEGWREFKQVEN